MSWSFKHIGTRKGVAAKILAENYVPESVKTAIVEAINAPTKSSNNGVIIESNGHIDAHSSYLKIEMQQGSIALDPPEVNDEPPAPPPAADGQST